MTEKQVGFLYKVATMLSPITNDNVHNQLLRSYYLMRCREVTKGYGLPRQQFSDKNRCSFCCLEWTGQLKTKVKSPKVTKRQRKRIRQKKRNKDLLYSKKVCKSSDHILCCICMVVKTKDIECFMDRFHSIGIVKEQICSFCKHSNSLEVLRPNVESKNKIKQNIVHTIENSSNNILEPTENPHFMQKGNKINVYSNAKEVFSLSNKKNTLSKTVLNAPKLIKNNKKKKDKFAGLCKQAVLAAAKLKEKKEEQSTEKPNKLFLFLKPSAS